MRTGCRDSKFRTFLRVFSLCVMGIFAMQSACSIAAAEASTVTAVGNYRMGSYDTRGDAQRLAFLDAKWRLFDRLHAEWCSWGRVHPEAEPTLRLTWPSKHQGALRLFPDLIRCTERLMEVTATKLGTTTDQLLGVWAWKRVQEEVQNELVD